MRTSEMDECNEDDERNEQRMRSMGLKTEGVVEDIS